METSFTRFVENPVYRRYKNRLFNYVLRRRSVARHLRRGPGPLLDLGSGISPVVPDGSGAIVGDNSLAAMRVMRGEGFPSVVLDITRLGLRSDSVGTVVCSEVLEHVDQDLAALRELHRILRPGGELLLTVPLHRRYWSRDDELVGHFRRYDPAGLRRELELLGFEPIATARIGSLPERLLTVAAALTFARRGGGARHEGEPALALFGAANWLIARALELAAACTPLAWCSIGLFRCRKRPTSGQPAPAGS